MDEHERIEREKKGDRNKMIRSVQGKRPEWPHWTADRQYRHKKPGKKKKRGYT